MQPFSITLFATTGDPEGIRHVDKSNWSGYGVVFTRLPSGWQPGCGLLGKLMPWLATG